MNYLGINRNICGYKEKDKRLKEQFINVINDDAMMTEITKELTAIKREIMSP